MTDVYEEGEYKKASNKRTNKLLVRVPIGKSKPSTYNLPPENFTYGGRNKFDDFTVRDVISTWNVHEPKPVPVTGKDFIKANRTATIAGATNTKQITQFRQTHQFSSISTHPHMKNTSKSSSQNITHDITNQDRIYGQPSKPSTPIHNILNNQFQRDAIQQAKINKQRLSVEKATKKTTKSHPATHTRASLGHMKVTPQPSKAPFVMEKFANVPPKVNTYRFNNTSHNNIHSQSNGTIDHNDSNNVTQDASTNTTNDNNNTNSVATQS